MSFRNNIYIKHNLKTTHMSCECIWRCCIGIHPLYMLCTYNFAAHLIRLHNGFV